ncbi:MAG: hypothetical protein QNJ58_18395 [Desulfobacterales bacterium]|nr:hypothetical protein [Desulfobacterales bacterium]
MTNDDFRMANLSDFRFQISDFGLQIEITLYIVSGIENPLSRPWYLASVITISTSLCAMPLALCYPPYTLWNDE